VISSLQPLSNQLLQDNAPNKGQSVYEDFKNEEQEEEFINEYMRPVTVTVSDGNTFKTVIGD
jgi:hypothetical protein